MSIPQVPPRVCVVGRGRLGTALVAALRRAGIAVEGPHGRGYDGTPTPAADAPGGLATTHSDHRVILLAVPDREIAAAAEAITEPGVTLGHCSGATGLDALGERGGLRLHPLLSVAGPSGPSVPTAESTDSPSTLATPCAESASTPFAGAVAACSGTDDAALAASRTIATALGMTPVTVQESDRVAYHAGAATAANSVMPVLDLAERLARSAGLDRAALTPLVRSAVENWSRLGAGEALTGPVARGDEQTVAAHVDTVAERCPDDRDLHAALVAATRRLAKSRRTSTVPQVTDTPKPYWTPVLRTRAEVRARVDEVKAGGGTVALVPTMGALHEGHLTLIRKAAEACDVVVVSVFVNPTQFNDPGDLAAYPRDEERDVQLARSAGADMVFAPSVDEMYPHGHSTTVHVTGVSEPLEGAHRGAVHFDGVATVCTKLFLAVGPDVAFFGRKDAQQLAVIRRVVADLGLDVRIEGCDTVREPDGLALSSRNVRLSAADRPKALALKAGLDAAYDALAGGAGPRKAEEAGRTSMVEAGVQPEYLAVVHPDTFAPLEDPAAPGIIAIAAPVGPVRLIDNRPTPSSQENP